MGKPGRKKGLYGTRGGKNGGKSRSENKEDDWSTFEVSKKENQRFEEYYKAQNIIPEEEWPAMLEALRAELPTTFRVTGSRAHAETINDLIKNEYIPTMQNVEWEGKKYDPPTQIPWYPGHLAWQLSAPKRVVRKTEPFKRLQKFLVGETEVGNLSRQEAVSMIPPLFLDVQPHHRCMDMCAAPGSKTSQIIEALDPHHTASSGLLIANDSDYKRTHMLVHQTGRMPSKGLIVTNLDAAFIPSISLGNNETLLFDRILADVPCSGDATLRKNLEIWKKWGANDGNSLHSLQLRILERGMKLLKPGGRLVYSTCSFNPVENEAVIAAAMNTHPGEFSLVDVSDQIPDLKRRPGMTSWKVATSAGKELTWHEGHEAYRKTLSEVPDGEKEKKPLASTAWPPSNASELGLERCMRLLPHDQDTGGFFVCVFQKANSKAVPTFSSVAPVELIPVPTLDGVTVADETGSSSLKRAASPSAVAETAPETKRVKPETTGAKAAPGNQKKPKRDQTFKEDPFSFVDPKHDEVQSIVDWFLLDNEFRRDRLLVRNDYGDPLRTLYIVNDIVKAVIENNEYSRLRIVSAGVKGFVRQDSLARGEMSCKWRVPGDGISEVVPHMNPSVVKEATLKELRIFLSELYPTVETFSSDAREWMEKAELGNVIVRFPAGQGSDGTLTLPLYLPVWKAKASLSLLIDKREKSMLSLRTFGEDLSPAYPKGGGGGLNKDIAKEDHEETPLRAEGEADTAIVAVAKEAAVQAEDEAIAVQEEAVINA